MLKVTELVEAFMIVSFSQELIQYILKFHIYTHLYNGSSMITLKGSFFMTHNYLNFHDFHVSK